MVGSRDEACAFSVAEFVRSLLATKQHGTKPSFDSMTFGTVSGKSSGNVITVRCARRPLPDGRRRGTHESFNVEIRHAVRTYGAVDLQPARFLRGAFFSV